VLRTDEAYGELQWALLSFGNGHAMFNAGGRSSAEDRREVDLYVETEDVDDLYQRLRERVAIREEPHDTFYGMRRARTAFANRCHRVGCADREGLSLRPGIARFRV
jgi:hypothetical protein